ncbi:MAG: hypothetical protein OEY51_14850 [Cyclobacteriaceae bacterium]|nr:hypothetical protein [Cyclobacteriaceae bacterium]
MKIIWFIFVLYSVIGCAKEEIFKQMQGRIGDKFTVTPYTKVIFYDVNLELSFMEFSNYHPTGIIGPNTTAIIVSNTLSGEIIYIRHGDLEMPISEERRNYWFLQDANPDDFRFNEMAIFSGYTLIFLDVTRWEADKKDEIIDRVAEAEFILMKDEEN